ncbi:MAG TPA: hypothetical protein VER03_17310, partial [Bryobacteraceae bacterium]|nr:hypothetical protein [Bryobacteraceae bacterium]
LALFGALALAVTAYGDEQITIQKVTVNTPSGTITGKVVGSGDQLVFVDDADPSKSFTLSRGSMKNYTNENGTIVVHMLRPEADASGTVSNVRITVIDQKNQAALTQWFAMPQERSRTVTTYTSDVKHDHLGKGECNGKLIADDTSLRFESISEANHSRSWNYNDLQKFDKEKDHSLLKVVGKNGEKYDFKTVNGKTAGGLYDLVSQKIVSARPTQQ